MHRKTAPGVKGERRDLEAAGLDLTPLPLSPATAAPADDLLLDDPAFFTGILSLN